MTATTVSAVQKVDDAYVEDASKNATDSSEQEVVVREFDPKFMRKTTLKVCLPCYRVPRVLFADFLQLDLIVMPLLTLIYLASSLDKSNLGNAKSLGMMKDIGNDPTGETYALLNSLYYVSYAPFSQYPPSLEKQDKADKTPQWYPSLCWVNVHAWSQSLPSVHCSGVSPQHALQVFRTILALLPAAFSSVLEVCFTFTQIGFSTSANASTEAGFSPLIQVFLSRFYAREKLGTRVAVWLAMAPLG
jgi:hypothetical protein